MLELRGHAQQKATIHDYIALIGIEERGNIEGEYINIKPTYIDYKVFRKILQEYDYPNRAIESSGSKNIKCFIDAANTKYEVVNNEGFSDYLIPTIIGAIAGVIFLSPLVDGLANYLTYCFNMNNKPSPYISAIIGTIAGGAGGYKMEDSVARLHLEQQAFVDAAHECYDAIHKPIGKISAIEMDVHG